MATEQVANGDRSRLSPSALLPGANREMGWTWHWLGAATRVRVSAGFARPAFARQIAPMSTAGENIGSTDLS
jgi:hypothetical protein